MNHLAMSHKKGLSKKIYFAIALLVIVCVVTAAIVYAASQPSPPTAVTPGVNVGDSFTYSIKGFSILGDDNAATPDYLAQYNTTEYYKVTVTAVNGTEISLDTSWKFSNGTILTDKNTIDVSNGMKTSQTAFWVIYAANLNVNDKLRPNGFDGLIVNSTSTQQFKNSVRDSNLWSIENEFFDVNDPTRSTYRYDYTGVTFDKQTGMMTKLTNYQQYNNPAMTVTITWTLTDCSLWAVQ